MSENASFQGYFTQVSFNPSEGKQLSYFQNGYFSKVLWLFHEPHTVAIPKIISVKNAQAWVSMIS
jgi:hypothetical protein